MNLSLREKSLPDCLYLEVRLGKCTLNGDSGGGQVVACHLGTNPHVAGDCHHQGRTNNDEKVTHLEVATHLQT